MSTQESGIVEMRNAPVETRMRWYAEMNSWRIPADLPFEVPDFQGDHRAQSNDPRWKLAWAALTDSLTAEEMSLGWWLHALGETKEAWQTWWNNGRRHA